MPSRDPLIQELIAIRAAVRDASFLGHPRHDGVGGHRPGAWAPQYHIWIDHPDKGEAWSACGIAFLQRWDDAEPAEEIPAHMRCQRRGCKERWPS